MKFHFYAQFLRPFVPKATAKLANRERIINFLHDVVCRLYWILQQMYAVI